ncbi:hypothetical protein Cob_v009924 [Colletotrichum orbiculare MAFF 240422]|uniref:Uncharacterized protein n=1 Tax=Colletotrichum orbiculare (strain 104-T / ATCC 96160 / CBS 514.97 / LARS 414 / MAFF 240422) TaxID=1213857 RepID=A0A484FG14_COLOR|nr:hypothetical protein Cob_v009924 [Colletotrichum orbiculare MAFF 240422]
MATVSLFLRLELFIDNDDPIFDVQLVLSYPELTPWYGSDLFTAIINEDELLLCEVLGTGSELWEEDAALIELLESLVAEFEVKLDEMACQLSHFMKTYWAARMEQVEEELEEQRMTKENRDGIEELGITLRVDEDSASEDSVSEDSASEDSVHEHFESVYCSLNQPEFWLKEIAKIKEKASGK